MPPSKQQKDPATDANRKAFAPLEAAPEPRGKGALKRKPKPRGNGGLNGDEQLWEVEKIVATSASTAAVERSAQHLESS